MAWVDNGSTNGEMMLIGGIADSYSCGERDCFGPGTHLTVLSDVHSFLPRRRCSLPSHGFHISRLQP